MYQQKLMGACINKCGYSTNSYIYIYIIYIQYFPNDPINWVCTAYMLQFPVLPHIIIPNPHPLVPYEKSFVQAVSPPCFTMVTRWGFTPSSTPHPGVACTPSHTSPPWEASRTIDHPVPQHPSPAGSLRGWGETGVSPMVWWMEGCFRGVVYPRVFASHQKKGLQRICMVYRLAYIYI